MGISYKYIPCHPLTRQQLAPALNVSSVRWTEVRNANAALEATVTLPEAYLARSQLRAALEPEQSALYVKASDGTYPFGGVVIDQDLDWNAGQVKVLVQDWRSWLYSVFLGPEVDLSDDNIYTWTQVDQLVIARAIVAAATAGGTADGRPVIGYGSNVSGRLRNLNVKGTDFKYAGELLDSIAQRDDGFEWGIDIMDGDDHLPELVLALDYPERGGTVSGLILMQTEKSANVRPVGSIRRTSTETTSRQWATGAAENNASGFSVDSDPALPDSQVLLRERVTSYSTVTSRDTLASHARSERAYRSAMINQLDIEVTLDSPLGVHEYRAGDRCRLVLKNGWYDIDLDAVKIIAREINPPENKVVLSLDLEDYTLPEADAEGSIA